MLSRTDLALDALFEQKLQAGDESVLSEALQRYETELRARLRRQFPDSLQEADLDDAISMGLYRLWRYRQQYDAHRSPFGAWFYLLTRSAAFDLLRRLPRVSLTDPRLVNRPFIGDKSADVDPATTLRLQNLERAMQQLSELDRRILMTFATAADERGWSEPLADELRMPASTIRSRKMRALARLRDMIQRAAESPASE
ncbi:MAG TPA: sigma-70 family RNA polymerase sigma factor [Pirellulales bacterium]